MKTRYISVLQVAPLLVLLFGCQQAKPMKPAVPEVEASAPAAATEATPMMASEPAAMQPAPEPAPAPEAVAVEQTMPAAAPPVAPPKPAAAPAAVAPSKPAAAPAPVAKREVKAESVLSDADARALAQRSGCFACHAIDKKLVGPAWKDVAAKYRGQPDAEARLTQSVTKGSRGVWGASPMPPNAQRVNAADTKALVRFILSLR